MGDTAAVVLTAPFCYGICNSAAGPYRLNHHPTMLQV